MADPKQTQQQSDSLSSDELSGVYKKPTEQQKEQEEEINIDWSQSIPSKSGSTGFISVDPNNFFVKNLQFLSGQKSAMDKENVKRPIFRLAILLDSGKNSLAKAIHVPNATNPNEIENVPSDYLNILMPSNLNNLSVYFLDFTFSWTVDQDRHNWLHPEWVNFEKPFPFVLTMDLEVKPREVRTMQSFHLRPYGPPKKGVIYTNNNVFCKAFWKKMLASFNMNEEDKTKYTQIYTIWFQKKYFGYNVLDEIFKDNYSEQVQFLKDTCLNKKIIDLFELSDLVAKNDMISKKNNIFLLFTKWLNYKNTTMSTSTDIYNKKSFELTQTENVSTDFFKRLDDFFYYSVKCFFNIIDQCLYENSVNQIGSNGVLLEDFFKKDLAIGGTNQDNNTELVDFVDDKELAKDKDTQTPVVPANPVKRTPKMKVAKAKVKAKTTSKTKPKTKTTRKGKK